MATALRPSSTRLKIGPTDHGLAVSDEDYASADFEEPWRYELVDGRIVVVAPDSGDHDLASEPIRDYLGAYLLTHRDIVDHGISEPWVRLEPGKSRIGDIGVFLAGARSTQSRPERVPELMIEVLSPGKESLVRDTVEKKGEYYDAGVLEYVIVNYVDQQVTVLTHTPGGYESHVLTAEEVYTTPLLPGLAIPLAEVFSPR